MDMRSIVRRILLTLDRNAARRMEKEAQDSLKRATNTGRARDELGRFVKQQEEGFGRFGKLLDSIRNRITGLAAGITAGAVGRFIFNANRQAESLQAQLRVTEGNAESARAVFAAIEQFATRTPFQIEEVTRAFLDLRAAGIRPTEAMLTAFGDIASARGKNITDFSAAVQDALTGEMERLKEFGIVAKQSGDTVTFSFNGQTQTVARTRDGILGYLEQAGKVPGVTGAMAEQMTTLNGLLSNAADNAGAAARIIGEEGLNDALRDALGSTVEFTGKLEDNRAEIGHWTRGIIAAAKLILAALALVPRALFNTVQATAASLFALFARVELEYHTRLHRIKSRTNELIEGLNRLPGVNIAFRFDTSSFEREAAEARRQFQIARSEFVDAGEDIGDAFKDVGRAAAEFWRSASAPGGTRGGGVNPSFGSGGSTGGGGSVGGGGARATRAKTPAQLAREEHDELLRRAQGVTERLNRSIEEGRIPALAFKATITVPEDIGAAASANRLRTLQDDLLQHWIDRNGAFVESVHETADEVVGAWSSAFEALFAEGATLGDFFENVARGIGSALIGGLGEYATKKARMNVLEAAEQIAKGFAALANPLTAPTAPGHFAAAAKFMGVAALWGAAAGVGGGAAGAIGGRGGSSAPRGSYDVGGRTAREAQPKTEVHVYPVINPLRADDPQAQSFVYHAGRNAVERMGDNWQGPPPHGGGGGAGRRAEGYRYNG